MIRGRGRARAAACVAGLLGLLGTACAGGDAGVHEFTGPSMGTRYAVTVDADLTEEQRAVVSAAIEARLGLVTRLLSTYDADSEISRFNRHESTEPFPLSPETMYVLTMAREVSERSRGAFDVTVGVLVDAWGFGPSPVAGTTPDSARLASLMPLVGWQNLVLDSAAATATKLHPSIEVDPTAIAQGWAAEAVSDTLRALGLERFLVDTGGELRAVGTRRDGRPWRVGIEPPSDVEGGIAATIDLTDEGIDTSGDYRNYFEQDGVRYAHLIDPRTGRAIRMRNASVTVVHDDTAMADAWATALMVLGPEEGWEVALRENLAAAFLTLVDGRVEARVTPAMGDRLVVAERSP